MAKLFQITEEGFNSTTYREPRVKLLGSNHVKDIYELNGKTVIVTYDDNTNTIFNKRVVSESLATVQAAISSDEGGIKSLVLPILEIDGKVTKVNRLIMVDDILEVAEDPEDPTKSIVNVASRSTGNNMIVKTDEILTNINDGANENPSGTLQNLTSVLATGYVTGANDIAITGQQLIKSAAPFTDNFIQLNDGSGDDYIVIRSNEDGGDFYADIRLTSLIPEVILQVGEVGIGKVSLKVTEFEGIRITDTYTNVGMGYSADYRAIGVSTYGDRWITDWGIVKDHLGGQTLATNVKSPGVGQDNYVLSWNNGTSKYELRAEETLYSANSTITGNRTVDGGGNTLTFFNSSNFVINSNGDVKLITGTTGALVIPTGANPDTDVTTPENGMIKYDTTDHEFRAYVNGAWTALGGGGGVQGTGTIGKVPVFTGASTIGDSTLVYSGLGNDTLTHSAVGAKFMVDSGTESLALINNVIQWNNGTFSGELDFSNAMTGNRSWDLPNASGTIALLSDITGADGNGIFDAANSGGSVAAGFNVVLTDTIRFGQGTDNILLDPLNNQIVFQNTAIGTATGTLVANVGNLANTEVWTLPENKSGTIALLSDVSEAADGNGIYDGSGTIPTLTTATITDSFAFTGGDLFVKNDGGTSNIIKTDGSLDVIEFNVKKTTTSAAFRLNSEAVDITNSVINALYADESGTTGNNVGFRFLSSSGISGSSTLVDIDGNGVQSAFNVRNSKINLQHRVGVGTPAINNSQLVVANNYGTTTIASFRDSLGAQRLNILDSGLVDIDGTVDINGTNAQAKLVVNDASGNDVFRVNTSSQALQSLNGATEWFRASYNFDGWWNPQGATNAFYFGSATTLGQAKLQAKGATSTAAFLAESGNGTYQTIIEYGNSGYTGIGLNNPTAKLHVKGIDQLNTSKSLLIQSNIGTDLFKVTNLGKVGIRTTADPSAVLEISATSGDAFAVNGSNGAFNTIARLTHSGASNRSYLAFDNDTTSNGLQIYYNGTTAPTFANRPVVQFLQNLAFNFGNTEIITFETSGNIDATGYKAGGTAGFTGTGAYTNFTIVGGIITAAS